MWVSRYRVNHFSSFEDSDWIDLDPGFNLFIGQNNSGKSALLKAFHVPLADNPHKNRDSFRGKRLISPSVEFNISITVQELRDRFNRITTIPTFPGKDGSDTYSEKLRELLSSPSNTLVLELIRRPGQDISPHFGASLDQFRESNQANQVTFNVQFLDDGPYIESRVSNPDNLSKIFSTDVEAFFYFDAQRLNVARSTFSSPQRLLPDARNLPAVLAYLQGSRKPVFDIIENHVIDIITGIARITVTPRENDFEILVWPERESRYEQLAFGLDESGTGVGQLLAIITAAVTSDQSVIIIDEINSFLHPSSVKKLISILRSEYSHHQYIISTHSSDVIAGSNAERIYIVTKEGFQSNIKQISLGNAEEARHVAATLGFSMMDVFGHDRIIWVEGPTEEICFQFLARQLGLIGGSSIGFASVASTDVFSGKGYGRSVTEIYERAGKRLAPLLRGMAFGLDRERLSDEAVAKLERSMRKLRFLPRRCIENYFLNLGAIAAVVSDLDERAHTEEAVLEALKAGGAREYGGPQLWKFDIANLVWLKKVDGAKLLNWVFGTLTGNRVEYRKTRDGISLLKWIHEHEPESLTELTDFLKRLLEIAQRDTAP